MCADLHSCSKLAQGVDLFKSRCAIGAISRDTRYSRIVATKSNPEPADIRARADLVLVDIAHLHFSRGMQ